MGYGRLRRRREPPTQDSMTAAARRWTTTEAARAVPKIQKAKTATFGARLSSWRISNDVAVVVSGNVHGRCGSVIPRWHPAPRTYVLSGGRSMKVLVATVETQGQRPNDFNYCVDGRAGDGGLVWPPTAGTRTAGAAAVAPSPGSTRIGPRPRPMVKESSCRRRTTSRRCGRAWPSRDGRRPTSGTRRLAGSAGQRWPAGTVVERRSTTSSCAASAPGGPHR